MSIQLFILKDICLAPRKESWDSSSSSSHCITLRHQWLFKSGGGGVGFRGKCFPCKKISRPQPDSIQDPKYGKWKFLTFIKEDPSQPSFRPFKPPHPSSSRKNWGDPIFSSIPPPLWLVPKEQLLSADNENLTNWGKTTMFLYVLGVVMCEWVPLRR